MSKRNDGSNILIELYSLNFEQLKKLLHSLSVLHLIYSLAVPKISVGSEHF